MKYAAFLDQMAQIMPQDLSKPMPPEGSRLVVAFMQSNLDAAAGYLDDAVMHAVLQDTAASFREAREVYPELCSSIMSGQTLVPSPEKMRALFKPERLRTNIAMLERGAENKRRVEAGELKLAMLDEGEIGELLGAFFETLPQERVLLMALIAEGKTPPDHKVSCDIAEGLYLWLDSLPVETAGPAVRTLSSMQ